MKKVDITLILGDGIGPEVMEAAKKCIDNLIDVNWHYAEIGSEAEKKYKKALPEKVIDLIKKTKIALKGPVTTPIGGGFHSVNVLLRKKLDLFANIRPCKSFQGILTPYKNIDITIVRENTEDLYSGIEFRSNENKFLKNILIKNNLPANSTIALKTISSINSKRILEYAFNYAKMNKRKKVTVIHKANIMKITDGLFLKEAIKVAKKFPSIKFESAIVDNMAMQLVKNPNEYDILATPNLYGDILSDLCAGLVGGLGLVAGANIGNKYAVFETVHGSAPKYANKNKVNPIAAILASAMMLKHLKKEKEAIIIENAVKKVIKQGRYLTYDLTNKNPVGTKEMTNAILKEIKK